MIRLVNMNAAFLALTLAVAFGNYHVKYEAERQSRTLAEINREIAAEAERERVLEADWSHVNEPARLQALADRHLSLGPIKATQVTAVADLDVRLPLLGDDAGAIEAPLQIVALSLDPERASRAE